MYTSSWGVAVDLDQAQPNGGNLPLLRGGVGLVYQPGLGLQGDAEHLVVVLANHSSVLVGGSRAYPNGVGEVRHQAGERRDQPAPRLAVRADPSRPNDTGPRCDSSTIGRSGRGRVTGSLFPCCSGRR